MSVKYAVKELIVRRHRTVVNCIGIAVAAALVISLYSLSNAYKEAIRKPFEASGVDLVLQRPKAQMGNSAKTTGVILPESATLINNNEVQKLTGIDGIDGMATSIQVWSFDRGNFKVIEGIDPDAPAIGPVIFKNWVNAGRFFNSGEKGVAVVEKHYAKFYGLKVGDKINIAGEEFKIIGTVEVKSGSQLSAPNFFLPISDVRHLAGISTNSVNEVYLRLKKATSMDQIEKKIEADMPGVKISSPDSSLSSADSLFSLAQNFIWLISIIIIIVAALLIFKTVSSNISERIKEIGIMKTVGWTGRNIRRQFTLEMTIQGIVGGLFGVIFGLLLSFGLSVIKVNASLPWQGSPIPGSTGTASGNTGLVPLHVSVSPLFITATLIATLLVTVFCGLVASKRAVHIKPAEAIRKI